MIQASQIAGASPDSSLEPLLDESGTRNRVRDMILESGFFADLDRDEIEMLAVWIKAYSAPSGTVILTEGDDNACLCVIVNGNVNIFKETTPGEHVRIAKIGAGASIGEMGVVDGLPLSASAVAATDTLVLIITGTDFENLMRKNSNLGVKVLLKVSRIISQRLRHTTGRLADLLKTTAE